jgi:hypothetical protein
MRHAGKARDRGELNEYIAGSGTQRAGMPRRSNAIVFMDRCTLFLDGEGMFAINS